MHRFPKCAISPSKFSFFWRLFLSESSRQVTGTEWTLWEAFSNISRCRGVRRLLSGTHKRCWIGERDPDTMNQLIWYYDWYSRKGFQKNVENIFIQIRLILVMISIWQTSPSFPRYQCFLKVLGYHQVFNSKIDPNLGIQPLNSSNFMDGTAAFLF